MKHLLNWKEEYFLNKSAYESLVNEGKVFIKKLRKKNSSTIDIVNIVDRLKTKQSIENNFSAGKYVEVKSIVDIKDIAGIRITCHCEDDVENLATILEGELRQKYLNVTSEDKGGVGTEYPYRAKHIVFSKLATVEGNSHELFCEIQIRTVMADAWAVQNHKYIYKKSIEGEAHELTNAVSEIMKGCEKLWSLVKKKSAKQDITIKPNDIPRIKSMATSQSSLIRSIDLNSAIRWLKNREDDAHEERTKANIVTYVEYSVHFTDNRTAHNKIELKDAAQVSTIPTFGWPIAVYLNNSDEYKPVVITEGIRATISINRDDFNKGKTFDYWAIHESGAFYTLTSLFEDLRNPQIISFNTQIVKITELFMYLRNLYTKLKIGGNINFVVTIKHVGLKGRNLSTLSSNRLMLSTYIASEDEVMTSITTNINEFEENPTGIVKRFTEPLFEIFDFFRLDDKVLEQIVTDYLNGKVS